MVKILIVDTETTGLFQTKGMNAVDKAIKTKGFEKTIDYFNKNSDNDCYPYITQMSFIIYDTQKQCICQSYNTFIDLDIDIKIHKIASKVTHMYACTKDAIENGENILDETLIILSEIKKKHPNHIKTIEEMMDDFISALNINMCDCIVAHNVFFDVKMLLVEAMRLKNTSYFKQIFEIKHECTMLQSIEICNLMIITKNHRAYKKYPKLQETYEKLFHDSLRVDALHNALYDAYICLKIYCKLNSWKQPFLCESYFKCLNVY